MEGIFQTVQPDFSVFWAYLRNRGIVCNTVFIWRKRKVFRGFDTVPKRLL
jgi:hypothetical protein